MSSEVDVPEPEVSFITKARELAGDHLRGIASYAQTEYEFHYIRDDVEEAYTEDEFDKLRDALLMEVLHRPYLSQVFGDQQLDCQVLAFEESVILNFPNSEFEGHVISVDREGLADLDELVEACRGRT